MEMQHLSKEEKEELIQELTNYREVQAKGAQVSNKAAAVDFRLTLVNITTEVRKASLPSYSSMS